MRVSSESPTHFCMFTNSVNIIDRLFRSATGWMMRQMMTDASTIDNPEAFSSKGVSDHAALS
eukprot:5068959-Pyramimonas_sp.AAC.1